MTNNARFSFSVGDTTRGLGLDHICIRLGPTPPSLPTPAWELFLVGNQGPFTNNSSSPRLNWSNSLPIKKHRVHLVAHRSNKTTHYVCLLREVWREREFIYHVKKARTQPSNIPWFPTSKSSHVSAGREHGEDRALKEVWEGRGPAKCRCDPRLAPHKLLQLSFS